MLETPAYVAPLTSTSACVEHNSLLNQVVVDLNISLLQFSGEVSLWSPASAQGARDTLARLIQQQKDHSEQLVQLLINRGWPVEFGTYPSEFTDLHFLSLKALLPRIITNQSMLLTELDEAVHTCIDDADAAELLNAVLAGERSLTAELKSIIV